MTRPIVRSNPCALLDAVLSRGISVTEAAKLAGVDRATFDALIRYSKPVTVKTASKITKAFGNGVVSLVTPRQRELAQLRDLREEFVAEYPDDDKRLAVLDEMIRDAENTGGNHDAC